MKGFPHARHALLLTVIIGGAEPPKEAAVLHPEIEALVTAWADDGKPTTIDAEREASLRRIAEWIAERGKAGKPAQLTFVCTHNSRRSHMSQLWAQAAALHHGLAHVETFSGGTEATAFNPRSVTALSAHGYVIEDSGETVDGGKNVIYATSMAPGRDPIRSFSKEYADAANPQQDFAAVMVCSSADEACPFVEGADLRVAVPFLDPKVSDDTPEEGATYLAKSEEIGREMVWLMKAAAQGLKPEGK